MEGNVMDNQVIGQMTQDLAEKYREITGMKA